MTFPRIITMNVTNNLISKSGYRFAAQDCTNVNINARSYQPPHPPQKKYNTSYRIQEIYLQIEE